MFQTKVVEKIKTHILCSIFFFENHAVYEIMLQNSVQTGKPQLTVWCLVIARWIPKATNTYSEYVIRIVCTRQHWLHEHTRKLRYTYSTLLSCYLMTTHLYQPCLYFGLSRNWKLQIRNLLNYVISWDLNFQSLSALPCAFFIPL